MRIQQGPALIGAIAAAVPFGAFAFFLAPLLVVALAGATTVLGYVVGRLAVGSAAGEAARGVLIGVNAAANLALARWAYGALFGAPLGLVLGLTLATLVLLCAVRPIAASDGFQGVLGYLSVLMPMSWPIIGAGLLFLAVEAIGGLVGLIARVDFLKLKGASVDWKTGTFFVQGGLVGNLNFRHTAFNMGSVGFLDRAGSVAFMDHEAGHALNLAAFGSVFHLVGAADENLLGGHDAAFAEVLAESNNPSPQFTVLPMWR